MKNESLHIIGFKMTQAARYEQQEKFLHAMQIYHTLISDFPDAFAPFYHLALLYEKLGFIDEALALLDEISEGMLSQQTVRLALSEFYLRHERWENVLSLLAEAGENQYPLVSYMSGVASFMLNDPDSALPRLEFFLSVVPAEGRLRDTHFHASILLASVYEQRNLYPAMLRVLPEKVADSPFAEKIYCMRAKAFFFLSMYTHAEEAVVAAFKTNPQLPETFELIGTIFLYQKDYVKLFKLLLPRLGREDNPPSFYVLLGETYYQSGYNDEAETYFALAAQLDPSHPDTVAFFRNFYRQSIDRT